MDVELAMNMSQPGPDEFRIVQMCIRHTLMPFLLHQRKTLHAVCFLQDSGKVVQRALRHQHCISDHWLICEELHSQRLARVDSGAAVEYEMGRFQ